MKEMDNMKSYNEQIKEGNKLKLITPTAICKCNHPRSDHMYAGCIGNITDHNYDCTCRSFKPHPLSGKPVFYYHSSSEIHKVTFLRWCRMKMNTGGKDTNKIGTGAIVYSDWLYSKLFINRPDHGLRRDQNKLRPYWDLYLTKEDAYNRRNPIKRPDPKKLALEKDMPQYMPNPIPKALPAPRPKADMSKVDAVIEHKIAKYPSLYHSRTEALHHLFIVLGNGYEWVNGSIVDNFNMSAKKDEIPRSAAKILAHHRIKEIEHPYPWTSGCLLATMPKDAKPEWKLAAKEIVKVLKNHGYKFKE